MKARKLRGVVLVVVIWLLAVGAILALNVASVSRIEVQSASASLNSAHARAAAESAIWLALSRLLGATEEPWPADGTPVEVVPLEPTTHVSILAQDGLVDLNTADEASVRLVLSNVLEHSEQSQRIADELFDWRDADFERRPYGAEKQAYAAAGHGARPRDGAFFTLGELGKLASMDADTFKTLAPYFTVHGEHESVQSMLAPAWVREVLGETGAAAPTETDGAALVTTTNAIALGATSFLIKARGQRGRARRHLLASVLVHPQEHPGFTVLEWREDWYDASFVPGEPDPDELPR